MHMNVMRSLLTALLTVIAAATAFGAGPDAAAVPQRIISLSPATTEILFSLGLNDRMVGVTTFCDQPEEAKRKAKAGGMSNPSLEAIVSLRPDIVVLTTDGNPREVEDRLKGLRIQTYVWTERTLAGLPQGIRTLGQAMGVASRGEELAGEIERTLKSTKNKVQSKEKIKAMYIVWPEPLMVAGPGTAVDDAMTLLGMENVAKNAVSSYPRYSIEEVIREAPEVLFIGKATGMDMRDVAQGFLKKLGLVPAVRNGRVCYVSDSLYRLGPRVVQGIEELAACVR